MAFLGLLGAGLGAAASIYGANVQQQDVNATNQMNYQLGQQNMQNQMAMNQQNLAYQQQFAQNDIQWKVADAKAAGINPLAALGASETSFSNLVAPQNTATMQAPNVAPSYSQAGQNISRALSAIQDPADRAVDQAAKALSLQKTQAEIDLLHSQSLAVVGHGGTGAAGNPPGIPNLEPGVSPTHGATGDVSLSQLPSGDRGVVVPPSVAALGFMHPMAWQWMAREGIMPAFSNDYRPGSEVKRGSSYNPFLGTYTDHPWFGSHDPKAAAYGYNYDAVGNISGSYAW